MKKNLLGVDIGGTKCAVTYGGGVDGKLDILDKERFATTSCQETIANLIGALHTVMERNGLRAQDVYGMGISCGGPLDSRSGVVMSPPNLPGWDNIPIVKLLSEATGVRAGLHNDANACALAEWTFGAGKGTRNMAFLTFGTGLGAGLILDGKLYAGTNDNAGELGHLRLASIKEKLQMGGIVPWCPDVEKVTAKDVAEAMASGDALATEIFTTSARYLGIGLSVLIDIINPERIVIGSIYTRNEGKMRPIMWDVIQKEALPLAAKVCEVVPAALGEAIGDYAALSIAYNL